MKSGIDEAIHREEKEFDRLYGFYEVFISASKYDPALAGRIVEMLMNKKKDIDKLKDRKNRNPFLPRKRDERTDKV